MLMGKHRHSVDAKNRLIIPAKLKDQLGDDITIIKDSDKCLVIYSEAEWQKYVANFENLPRTEAKAVARFLYANAEQYHLDSQGRVLLSQEMINYAGIQKSILTVGCGKYCEIWAEEVWNEKNLDAAPENYTEILRSLGL